VYPALLTLAPWLSAAYQPVSPSFPMFILPYLTSVFYKAYFSFFFNAVIKCLLTHDKCLDDKNYGKIKTKKSAKLKK